MPRQLLRALFALQLLLLLVHSAPLPRDAFWTTVTLKSLSWRPECITDRNCADMTFSLVLDSAGAEGRKQASWALKDLAADVSDAPMSSEAPFRPALVVTRAPETLFPLITPCSAPEPAL